MRYCGLAAVFALALGSFAGAGPLDTKQIPADAQWVLHADVDAMTASTVVRSAYKEFVDKCPLGKIAEAILDKSRDIVGMDPRKDLHAITAYGKKLGSHEGVLIVVADVNQKLLVDKVKQAPNYQTTKYGSYEIGSWTHVEKHERKPVAGVFYKPTVVVFSATVDEVKAALDVLDGKAKQLEKSASLGAAAPAGATLLLRAVGISTAKLPGDPPIAKQFDSLDVAMGESKGTSFCHAKVVMTSSEAAAWGKDVLLGVRALGLLGAGGDRKELALAESLKVRAEGKVVTADFEAPAEAVWQHIQKHIRRAIEVHKAHGK